MYSGVNAGKPPAPEQRVRFLLGPMEGSEEKALTLTATSVPSLTNHPLGKAPSGQGLGVTPQVISAQSPCPSQCLDSCLGSLKGHSRDDIFDQGLASFPEKSQIVNILSFAGSTLPL